VPIANLVGLLLLASSSEVPDFEMDSISRPHDSLQANWQGGDTTRVTSEKCIQFEDQVNFELQRKLSQKFSTWL
jgi:hypothetical protein